MVNLMRNSFEAVAECEPDCRRLEIRTSVQGADRVLVEVCDSGRGVAPNLIDRVFDRFFTTKLSGMGMGLPISRSIIENHGGSCG